MTLRVSELFYSLQGEGAYVGVPMFFVRLQGCNLFESGCCKWCDTKYAQDPHSSHPGDSWVMAPREIAEHIKGYLPYYGSWVCITGGEPLLQAVWSSELRELVKLLKENGHHVEIETNGTLAPPSWFNWVNSWVADIKCPSSGVKLPYMERWLKLRRQDQIKFVVEGQRDLDFVHEVLNSQLIYPEVFVQPIIIGGNVDVANSQVVWEFCKEHRVRFSIQEHKIVWGAKRGV